MIKKIIAYIKGLFGKKDYAKEYSNLATSEARYLEDKVCYRPKHSKMKNFVISCTIYALFMSLSFNILLIREVAELRDNVDFIVREAQRLNADNVEMVEAIAKNPKVKEELKRIEIRKEKGKYIDRYHLEAKENTK